MSARIPIHSHSPRLFLFLGVRMSILLSSAQTGGQFSLIEGFMPPGGDGGLHLHRNEDESMHLLEGSLDVMIGEQAFRLGPGESYFAPRGVPHRLRNRGDVPARSLLVTTPGGFDDFVARAGTPLIEGAEPPRPAPPTPEQMGQLLKLAEEFGIGILGPPEPPDHA
ncbi:MAG TPA: cupin domain-containing protein [Acetobacteraceae bacterium]|nr:cupin domain-containing protein [Acetobacteraceae bacterium]